MGNVRVFKVFSNAGVDLYGVFDFGSGVVRLVGAEGIGDAEVGEVLLEKPVMGAWCKYIDCDKVGFERDGRLVLPMYILDDKGVYYNARVFVNAEGEVSRYFIGVACNRAFLGKVSRNLLD